MKRKKYEWHELAKEPPISEAAVLRIMEDIKKSGQLEPVALFEGKILDGRHRDLGCEGLGIETKTFEFVGSLADALAYKRSTNARNDFDDNQRAMLETFYQEYEKKEVAAARQRQREAGGDRRSKNRLSPSGEKRSEPPHERTSSAKTARKIKVSPRTYQRARKVRETGCEELIQSVLKGKREGGITLTEAENIVSSAHGKTEDLPIILNLHQERKKKKSTSQRKPRLKSPAGGGSHDREVAFIAATEVINEIKSAKLFHLKANNSHAAAACEKVIKWIRIQIKVKYNGEKKTAQSG